MIRPHTSSPDQFPNHNLPSQTTDLTWPQTMNQYLIVCPDVSPSKQNEQPSAQVKIVCFRWQLSTFGEWLHITQNCCKKKNHQIFCISKLPHETLHEAISAGWGEKAVPQEWKPGEVDVQFDSIGNLLAEFFLPGWCLVFFN